MTRLVNPPRCWSVSLVVLVLLGYQAGPLFAQSENQRNSKAVLSAFRDVVKQPSESTVRVQCDDKDAALGTIVAADGWVVTKLSLLKGKIVCKLRSGKTFPAKIAGVEEDNDLAMLKLDTTGLKPIEWRAARSAEAGDWLAATGTSDAPVAVGVVSVGVRKPSGRESPRSTPARDSGYLGIILKPSDEGGPEIGDVEPRSAADRAGLKKGDVILSVSGRKVDSPDRLVAEIQSFKAGQVVSLRVKRGDDEMDVKATLARRPNVGRGDRMNMMGSTLSERRGGFPEILQHDLVLKPEDCGGPVVDLQGKAVGINIARAGRTESYAIPAEVVQGLLSDLKSGKLAPKDDGAERVAELEKALKRAQTDALKAEEQLGSATAAKKKDLQKKLDELKKKVDEAQAALDKARKDRTKK